MSEYLLLSFSIKMLRDVLARCIYCGRRAVWGWRFEKGFREERGLMAAMYIYEMLAHYILQPIIARRRSYGGGG